MPVGSLIANTASSFGIGGQQISHHSQATVPAASGILILRQDLDVGIFTENIHRACYSILHRGNRRSVYNDDLSFAFQFVHDVLSCLLTGLAIIRRHCRVDSALRPDIDRDYYDSSPFSPLHGGRDAFAVCRIQ